MMVDKGLLRCIIAGILGAYLGLLACEKWANGESLAQIDGGVALFSDSGNLLGAKLYASDGVPPLLLKRHEGFLIIQSSPDFKNVTITTNPPSEFHKIGPGTWQAKTEATKGTFFGVICGKDYCRPYTVEFEIDDVHWSQKWWWDIIIPVLGWGFVAGVAGTFLTMTWFHISMKGR